MKKKKGFTLIELLSVIVILAIIALIAVPIILNVIENARKRAAVASALGYVRAVNYKIADEAMFNRVVDEEPEYVIGENALAVNAENIDNITGTYTLADGRVEWAGLCVGKYYVEYNNGYAELATGNCGPVEPYEYDFAEEKKAQSLEVLCTGNNANSIYSDKTEYKVESLNDLTCLSNLVNSGKNFSGKTIYLLDDLDFNDDNSYSDPNTTDYGDINGNGTVEGLKVELTTGAGFKPIGNNNNKFAGTFDGYAFTISNLMINRSTLYTGLFGYNNGAIKGLVLRNASVSVGKDSNNYSYGGILAGYSTGVITGIDVEGNITATGSNVGGVVGYTYKDSGSPAMLRSVKFKGNATGYAYVGGLGGSVGGRYQGEMTFTGVVTDTKIVATNTDPSNAKPTVFGYPSYVNRNTKHKNVSVKRATNIDVTVNTYDFPVNEITLESVDGALDTYIGGDNDGDGYYFDYDKDGNIVLYSTLRKPLNTEEVNDKLLPRELKGKGTEENPFLIRNAFDWKMASALGTQGKYFKLNTDLDFENNKFYALGTPVNKFNGNINGNMHKVSNVNVYGYDYTGLFSYNQGTIEGFKFENILIDGTQAYAGLIANNTGTVKGIELKNVTVSAGKTNDSTGYSYAGGLVGHNTGIISAVDVEGTVTGSGWDVGGVLGYTYKDSGAKTLVRSARFKGSVKGNSYVGGIAGSAGGRYQEEMTFTGVVTDSNIVATSTDTTNAKPTVFGYLSYVNRNTKHKNVSVKRATNIDVTVNTYDFPVNAVTLEAVDGALDTYIGGDNDEDGYYFDYDTAGNIVLYSTNKTPIENNLSGSGTEEDPYIIANERDWKTASTLGNKSKYFKVTADLDFENNKFYALGTPVNKFNGNINGDMHKVSNVSVYGYDYTGLFSYNSGTIEGFRFNNITINGTQAYAGLVANNTGTVKGIELKNVTVSAGKTNDSTGYSYAGGLVGYNVGGVISAVDVEGTVTGSGWNVGGVLGYAYKESGAKTMVRSAKFKGSVKGTAYVGGIAGSASGKYQEEMTFTGVVTDSSIVATSTDTTNARPTVFGTINYTNRNTKHRNVSVKRATTIDVAVGTYDFPVNAVTLEAVDGALDTYIGGDNDNDGYYFDYDSSGNIILYQSKNLTNTLAGSGTAADPYRITNERDWKTASLLGTQGKYFVLTSNLNFASNKFYALGTPVNKFNGHINGNMYRVSNVSVYGYDYTGLFSYNQGTIEGFRFNNITINGTQAYAGLVAHNTGTVKGIELKNVTVSSGKTNDSTGYSYTGGLVGYNLGIISDVDVEGTVTGSGWQVGGVAGYAYREKNTSTAIKSAKFKGNVTGNAYIGGLGGYIGAQYQNEIPLSGVVHDSSIVATNTDPSNANPSVFGYTSYTSQNTKYKNVSVKRATTIDVTPYGTVISSITADTVDGALDTYIGGDNDSDGYYFGDCEGSLVLHATAITPIGDNACVTTPEPVNIPPQEGIGVTYVNPTDPEVCTDATGGCMRFYIIAELNGYYTLLLDHNTSGNVSWALLDDFVEAGGDPEEWEEYHGSTSMGPVTANKQLAIDTAGWIGNPRLITANEVAQVVGADTALGWDSSKTYAAPVTDKNTQIGSFYFDGSGTNYSGWTTQTTDSTNRSKYAWLFGNTYDCIARGGCLVEDNEEHATAPASNNPGNFTIHGYWTSDAYNLNYPWAVTESGMLGSNYVTDTSNIGVRPVITLPISAVTIIEVY